MKRWRYTLAIAGIALMLFGAFRFVTQIPFGNLIILAVWLIGAVVIHDGVLSPAVVAVSWVLARIVPPRARRYLQVGLIVGALITVIAVPLILRRGSQPPSKALLLRNYGLNLTLLLAVIATLSLAAYAVRVAADLHREPPTDQRSR